MGRVISTSIRFIDLFTAPSKRVIEGMKRLGAESIQTGKQIQSAGKLIANVGSSLTKSITLPIAAAATAAVNTSNNFENAIAKVGTIADTTVTPLTELKKQVLGLSNDMGVAVTEIAEAQYQSISAGVETAKSAEFVGVAVKSAKGGFTDVTTAVNGLTTVLNAYGLEAEKATEISDQMLVAQNFGKTSFGLMAESMGNVIPIASSLDISTKELFSSIAVLTRNGIETSESITGLKAAFSNILKPSAEAAKMADKLGINFSSAHLKSVGFAKFLDEVKEKAGGNEAIMAKLFGSVKALNSMMVLTGNGAADFAKSLELMENSAGSTQAAYEKMKTPAEEMNISINKLKNAMIQFGSALTPIYRKIAEGIGKIADKLNNLTAGQVQMIVKIAAVAAAIGPAILIFGKLVTSVGSAYIGFGKFMKLLANFKGIAGLLASPAGVVIGILSGIAIAAFLIIKNWEKVSDFLSKVGRWFQDTFSDAGYSIDFFKNKFSSIGNLVSHMVGKLGDSCKKIALFFSGNLVSEINGSEISMKRSMKAMVTVAASSFGELVKGIETGLQVLNAFVSFFIGAFSGDWETASKNLRSSIKNILPEDISDDFLNGFQAALPVIKSIVNGIKASVNGFIQDFKLIFNNIKNIFDNITLFLKGVFCGDADTALQGLKGIFYNVFDGIGNIIKSGIHSAKNFVITALSDFLPEETVAAIAGVFDFIAAKWDVGVAAAKGFVDGFLAALDPILDNIKTIFDGVIQFFDGVFSGDLEKTLNGLKTIATGALDGLKNAMKAPFDAIGSTIKNAINRFKDLDIVKTTLDSVGKTIHKVFTSCGVNMEKFGSTMSDIKNRISSILNNLKELFEKIFGSIKKEGSDMGISFEDVGNAVKAVVTTLGNVIEVTFSAITGAISSAANSIGSIIDGIVTTFDGIIKFITGIFTGDWEKAWQGVVDVFKGIIDTMVAIFKIPINGVIGLINGAINGINGLGLSVPDWVPVIGGKDFQINIPTIPLLYKGTNNWAGGPAIIHDKGGEIVDLPRGARVYPHDKSIEMARKDGVSSNNGTFQVTIQKLADKIEVRNNDDIDRIAEELVLKMRKVVFNTAK